MADNRFNQVPGFGGGGFQVGPQNAAMHGMPSGMAPFMQTGMPMNPMMQQQMMMSQGMRFPMQGMRMGHPNTPPPPYNAHTLNSGIPGAPIRPRQTLTKTKGGQKSEKERFFEEQRQKLKQFGKPGAAKVNPDELIGSMFAAEPKPAQPKGKASSKQTTEEDEDDGFGDFLQGPSVAETNSSTDKVEALEAPEPEPEPEPQEEKKDLKSMMLEYSDLSAPKKAKGFHKPTLNEVQKTSHGHHKVAATSFHQSDHSRSWKQNTEDLEGLFQIPVAPAPQPAPVSQAPHVVYAPQQMMGVAMPPPASVAGYPPGPGLVPPSGPPPAYTDVAGSPGPPIQNMNVVASNHEAVAAGHSGSTEQAGTARSPTQPPEWFTFIEDQVPPVYRHVLEASLVDNKISTERLYPILLLSGLPREKLAHIWSICNTATPGQLIKHELWQVLALIALTQNNFDTSSPIILARCPVPPVPVFQHAQDTSGPATLPTTPQQHQVQPTHQPPSLGAPAVSVAHQAPASAAHPQQLQQQTHQIQQPSVAPATNNEEDDFADFQAATPSATNSTIETAGSKDEGFGAFIGGGGLVNSDFHYTPPPTLPTHNHQMGNGAVTIGNGSCQDPQRQQHQQHEQQVAPLSLASLPVDDKYGTNVRSFFCSSDSSTGHTSPSFEDDDFTDGRDSLSQVSTSEQSENEDIRNFENYVEEFNQKKEQPDASPLHCPFPAIQQTQGMKSSKGLQPGMVPPFSDLKNKGKSAAHVKLGTSNLTLSPGKGSKTTGLDLKDNISIPSNSSGPTNFKPASESSKFSGAIPPIPSGTTQTNEDDDFADFKSASFQTDNNEIVANSNDVSLIGDEDKYGALRVLTFDNDIAQPSLFDSKGQASTEDASATENQDNDDDDWADFSAATSTGDSSESQFTSVTSSTATAAESSPGPNRSVSNKDDILKLFNAKPPPTFASGNSSDITSEGGSKNGSLFGDDISTASTPAKTQGLDSTLFEDPPSSSSYSEQDPPSIGLSWGKRNVDVSDDWAAFGSENVSGLEKSSGHIFSNKLNASLSSHESSAATLGSQPVQSGLNNKPNATDDWGNFSLSSSSASDTFSRKDFPSQPANEGWGNFSHSTQATATPRDDAEDDWCDFSAAAENEATDEAGNFVTIKKQNLGTNEIMGLFKVRDDPATLSSYQLPPQPPAAKNTPKQSRSSHRSSGSEGTGRNNRRISSDFDDDLVPPPMDFGHDDDEDDHAFSRGYDLGDIMHRGPPVTTYSPFGLTHASPLYSKAGSNSKVKENKEDASSVNSLDLPSAKPSDPYGSDSQSISSADLTSSEMAGGGTGVVSAESKSLDSLDFKADVTETESSNSQKEETVSTATHHHPIQPQELLASMPDFADKYNIEREAQGSDRYGHEWERCLVNCCEVISEANTLFNTISSSSVCNEVLKSSQGSEYVTSVVEIYRVVCRVMTSMRSTAISTTELEQTLKNIDLAWNNLTAFLVGASLLPDQSSLIFTNCVLKSDSDHAQNLACGVCLLSVDSKSLASSSSTGPASNFNSCKLTYAGRQYHATCANFWVNRVDQTLPSLTLPELF